jgi:hypothetical protein
MTDAYKHSYEKRFNACLDGRVSMYADTVAEVFDHAREHGMAVDWIAEGYADYREYEDGTEIIRRSTGVFVDPSGWKMGG